MSWLLRKFGVIGLLIIFSLLIIFGGALFVSLFMPEAGSSLLWVLVFGFAGLVVAFVARLVKSVARQVKSRKFAPRELFAHLFVIFICLVFVGVLSFAIWESERENVLMEFSGGGGEKTTEVFALESPGELHLGQYRIVGFADQWITVRIYEEGMSDPIREVTSSYHRGETGGSVHLPVARLDPGSYYLKIEANLSWWQLKIVATD